MFKRKQPEGHPNRRWPKFHIVRVASPRKFGFGYWDDIGFNNRYRFHFHRTEKGFSIGPLQFWTNVSNRPKKLDRGLYEFTRQYGMSTYAWVNSKGKAFTLEHGVPVEEFYNAWERGVVYRMGRVEVWQNGVGFTPRHETISNPEESYRGVNKITREK